MENQPVFRSRDECLMWKGLMKRPSKKILDVMYAKMIASPDPVHPRILAEMMDAKIEVYGLISVSTLESLVRKSRPEDCGPALKAASILMDKGEKDAAVSVLGSCRSQDLSRMYAAEASIFADAGDDAAASDYARKALRYDPCGTELYDILARTEPSGPWKDRKCIGLVLSGKESQVPKDGRLRELHQIYSDWFGGKKDSATDRLINSSYYRKGDREFLLASARMSADEKDWRSARMMYGRMGDGVPEYVYYEAADANLAGRDPKHALEYLSRIDEVSPRMLKCRISAYMQLGSERELSEALGAYLDSESADMRAYEDCIRMLMNSGRYDLAEKALNRMEVSDRNDPVYLGTYSSYLLQKGDVQGARRAIAAVRRIHGKEPSVAVQDARIRLVSGDVKGAEKECSKILSSHPSDAGALVLKKDILMAKGDVKGALEVCRTILKDDPSDIRTMISMSGAMGAEGDVAGAVTMLRNVIRTDPSRDNIVSSLGFMMESGMYREVSVICSALEKEMSPDPVLRRLRGNALYNMGDYLEASVAYASAAELSPQDPVLWHSKGMADEARGDLESAGEAFGRAVNLDLNEPEYWISKADIQERTGDPFGAVSSLNRAIELDPGSVSPVIRKAVIMENGGRFREAMHLADICSEMEPDNVSIELFRIRLMRESGSVNEAVKAAKSIADRVRSDDTISELALCYSAAGRREDALQILRTALVVDDSSIRLRHLLESIEAGQEEIVPDSEEKDAEADVFSMRSMAMSMLESGDPKGALSYIERCISEIGDDPGLLTMEVTILIRSGNSAGAYDLASDAVKKYPRSGPVRESLADAELAHCEFRSAIRDYEKAVSMGMDIPSVTVKIGDAHEGLGHFDRSIECYEEAVSREPEMYRERLVLAGKHRTRGNLSRAETVLRELIRDRPDDAAAIVMFAEVMKDSRKDKGITEAYEMFRLCNAVPDDLNEEMAGILKDAGREEEASSLTGCPEAPVTEDRIKRAAEKVLRRANVSKAVPESVDFITSLGFTDTEAEEISAYLSERNEYGDIVPGSRSFQAMERLSHDVLMKTEWKDTGRIADIPLHRVFVSASFRDADEAKMLLSYMEKVMASDIVTDDNLKMVLDRVQGDSLYDIMRSCRVGLYQARQISAMRGDQ